MIIILTNKDDVTVDFIVRELRNQKIDYYRLNTEDIPTDIDLIFSIDNNVFSLHDKNKDETLDLKKVTAVYFRRAIVSHLSELIDVSVSEKNYLRGELTYILEGLYKILRHKYWLNNIYAIREAENKIYQLQVAQEIGFTIPQTVLSNVPIVVEDMANKCEYDCIIKPIKSGYFKDYAKSKIIFTSKLDCNVLADKSRIQSFPVFVQKHINKLFDLRCIVVGNMVYCAQIDSQANLDSQVDWRRGKENLHHSIHELPMEIADKCIKMTKKMGLNYSAIDLILNKNNEYIFLECNPNGQWAWLEVRLGFTISKSIVELLKKGYRDVTENF